MTMHALATVLLMIGSPDSASVPSLPQGWVAGWSCLASAWGTGTWETDHPVMDSTCIDAALSVYAGSEEVDLLITGSLTADSSERVSFRRGRALVKWPGTPWIGAGVFRSDRQPFIPGLCDPVAEWGWRDVDSLQGFGLYCGGILGFEGEYLMQMSGSSDTLTQLNVQSPWLGFAGVSYSRAQLHAGPSSGTGALVTNSIIIHSNFRYVKPWVLVAGAEGEPGTWAVAGQIRGFRPLATQLGDIEVIPGMAFAGDGFTSPGTAFTPGQRQLSLSALLNSHRYAAGAGIRGILDLESDSLSTLSISGMMVSTSGIRWRTDCGTNLDGDYTLTFAAGTFRTEGGAEISVDICNDSTRVTGRAGVSPRRDVSAELTVSADVEGTLDPSCRLDVTAFTGPVSGHFGILWEEDEEVSLIVGIRGFFR